MGNKKPTPVTAAKLLMTRETLQLAIENIDAAISVMTEDGIDTLLLKASEALGTGLSSITSLGTRAIEAAKQERLAKKFEVFTEAEKNRQRYQRAKAKSETPARKKPAKKKGAS